MTFSPDPPEQPNPPPALNTTYALDQKFKMSSIAGLMALAVMTVGGHYGFRPQPMVDWIFGPGVVDVQAYLTYFITIGVMYVVPMAWADIAKRLNNKAIAHAVTDDVISAPVTLAGIAKEVTKIEAADAK